MGRNVNWLYENPSAIDLIRDNIKNNGGRHISLNTNLDALDLLSDDIIKMGKNIGLGCYKIQLYLYPNISNIRKIL